MATVAGSVAYTAAASGFTTVSGSTSYTAAAAPASGTTVTGSTTYTAVASNTAPGAGADQIDIEPYATVALVGTDAQSVVAWTQTGGPTVALSGSGSVRTFVAPATIAGTVLMFRATDTGGLTDDVTVTVLPHNEWAAIGGVLVPLRIIAAAIPVTSTTFPADAAGVPAGWTRTVNLGAVDVTGGLLRLTTAATPYGDGPALVWTAQTAMADGDWTGDVGSSLAEQYHCVSVRADTITAGQYPTNGLTLELQPAAGQPFTSHWLFSKTVAGVKTQLDAGDFAMSATVRTNYRIQTIGSAIKLRLWLANTTEPSTWDMEIADGSVLVAGRFAVASNNGGAATAVSGTFDNFAATAISSGGVTSTAMPTAPPAGFTRAYAENFDKGAVPVGGFVVGTSGTSEDGLISASSPAAAYRSSVNVYPDGGRYPNSPSTTGYYPADTMSVRTDVPDTNGVLEIRTFTQGGIAKSGWIRPRTTVDQVGSDGKQQYVSYCHVAARVRVADISNTGNFGGVMLLIPNNWPQGGEIDYPEGAFNERIGGFFHYKDPAATAGTSGNYQLPFLVTPAAYWDTWHIFETFWTPGRLIHKMDGVTVLDTTDRVPTDLQKFVFQCGVHNNAMPAASAEALWQIDWITLDTYTP